MAHNKFCHNCSQVHNCRQLYQRLAEATCPSPALRATLAFLLPILVFVACLAILEPALAELAIAHELQTVLAFALALSITAALLLSLRSLRKLLKEHK